jgi:uncharacterized protein (DUF983 family)
MTATRCTPQPELWDLPKGGWARFGVLLRRALLLRCPECGSRGIFAHPWNLRDCCPRCGYPFTREEGYFLGAYGLNLVVSEIIGLGAVLVILFRSDLSELWQQVIAVTAAILLPVLFYPFSRTLWMAVDLMTRGEELEEHAGPGGVRR